MGQCDVITRVSETPRNFFVFSWGFTIGPAITQLYAEWREKTEVGEETRHLAEPNGG